MISEKQIVRTLAKLTRLEDTLEEMLFWKVGEVEMGWYQTAGRLHRVPERELFSAPGTSWGGEGNHCWFRGSYTVPPELAGKNLWLYPKTGAYEGMLWVDGLPFGNYASKLVRGSHGNHYCDMFLRDARPGQAVDLALELYAGHYCIGCMPLADEGSRDFTYQVGPAEVCLRDEEISDFLFDLKTLNELVTALDADSFRRADLMKALMKVHEIVYYAAGDVSDRSFRAALRDAHPILKEKLARKNSESAPFAGLIGHSHMDTAWLWTIDETVKKCARTYSNQISLMAQYPEYKFIQSSAYHGELIRRYYPALFERIRRKVAEGRYEPNGGVWVECDCNIVSGESLVRQFLWGQRFTRKYFGYTSDTFWLPDTFGYSPAIPQIMKQSGVKYFLTTKMAWNDTNRFPYDTFYWKGIDGTKVLAHLNKTHIWPSPRPLMEYVVNGSDCIREKTVSNMRLLSFGYGDGGGGPEFEMLEMARRIGDLEGLPRSEYTTVSGFMKRLEDTVESPSTYSGELYLELHRGTLTNQAQIKRNNRLAETALHNLEYVTVRDAMERGEAATGEAIAPLLETLLVNQFHDILPGTCIPPVHEQSLRETGNVIRQARAMAEGFFQNGASSQQITLMNTLSFERCETAYLSLPEETHVDISCPQQETDSLLAGKRLAVSGICLPAFSSQAFSLAAGDPPPGKSAFHAEGNVLATPYANVTFDDQGGIVSFLDRASGRELRGEGYPFNTFLIAEDVPSAWDNWDIDADLEQKFRPDAALVRREIVSDGAVEYRIRSSYRLTERSSLDQDMVFFADSPEVRFETMIHWNDDHRFLKVAFDTSIQTDSARHEVQFGCIRRSITRSTDLEKAKFEVSNQKYTDLSETRYGVALLNDCKYGVSVEEGRIRLSLHKGGARPDYTGDHGDHACVYSFLPHASGFCAEVVVRPAYALNVPFLQFPGGWEQSPLLEIDSGNVLAETVKPCEEEGRAFIVRLYECEGGSANTLIRIPGAARIAETNLLEEENGVSFAGGEARLTFRPFEIRTLKVEYGARP